MASRKSALASFLQSRRRRITPEQVGIRRAEHRRVAGLRREEVAWAAEIGITWYTWLEQGRPIKIAAKTLDRIARVLGLDDSENDYLRRLARCEQSEDGWATAASAPIRGLVEGYTVAPACAITPRWDVLASNPQFGRLLELGAVDQSLERNALWIMFVRDGARRAFPEWAASATQMVAVLRSHYASYVGNLQFDELIGLLSDASMEFATMWREEAVLSPTRFQWRQLREPESGKILTYETLNVPVPDASGQMMIFQVPASN